jgi:hypothetical protein
LPFINIAACDAGCVVSSGGGLIRALGGRLEGVGECLMEIQIDEKCMKIGEYSFRYDAYHFDADEYADLSSGEVLIKILAQWAKALSDIRDGDTIFLPFSLDDEWVECFKVTQLGDRLNSKYVWVNENGYALDVSNLSDFMATTHEIWKESPEVFGEWDKEEFRSALLNAKVTAA